MMRHLYERNIIEIKNEYTQFLLNIMIPLLNEGIKSLYYHSIEAEKKIKSTIANNPKFVNPGIVKIFQMYLKDIEDLNASAIEKETERIRIKSKCSEWFDDLVKAVIKSNIVLLTYNVSEKTCKLIDEKYHEKININDFVHKCYVECARLFYNNPEFLWHEFTKNSHLCDIKKNKSEVNEIIKTAVLEAIRKMLPMKLILREYLSNDYIRDEYVSPPLEKFTQIRDMIREESKDNIDKEIRQPDDKEIRQQIDKEIRQPIDKLDHEIKGGFLDKFNNSEIQLNHSEINFNNIKSKEPYKTNISTEDELEKINLNLSKLKNTFNSETSDFTLNEHKRQVKIQSESLLNIDIEHPKIN